MIKSYIECISLHKFYKTRNQHFSALRDINIQINKGEFIALRGKSGAGKTTLLSVLGGLIKPSSGKVIIDGKVISELNNHDLSKILASEIGIIFQSLNLLPSYTIYENIEAGLVPAGYSKAEMKSLILPFLEKFNLAEKKDLLPEQLSAGQQQKVAVVRTLVRKPEVILADEPTGSVDPDAASEIIGMLQSECVNRSVTVILATHSNIAMPEKSRVVILNNGIIESLS